MNAYVLFEHDRDSVSINRVYLGEGNIHKLRIEFNNEVEASLGPKPPAPGKITVRDNDGQTYQIEDQAAKKLESDWLNKRWELCKGRKFAAWLMQKQGWQEAEDVYDDSE
jgi:hypothetical protein